MFKNVYKGKKVLVTGHTGFKGSWLTTWLLELGAQVVGISKDIPTQPSLFEELKLSHRITHIFEDIRHLEIMANIISVQKPDFIFHLAAQPIVSVSYSDPVETFTSNTLGTVSILEALRQSNHSCVAVMITSDKAYDNIEQIWGYTELDQLGGKDIYSGSKGAAELMIKSYFHSFFKLENSHITVGIGRAGNVIGGGDWAKDRIVVDAMVAWSRSDSVTLRSPYSTRPWQHVLEPLSGYLTLGMSLHLDSNLNGEAFNFGPRAEANYTVESLIENLSREWSFESSKKAYSVTQNTSFHEAGLLKLNCDKALSYLNWHATLSYEETIRFTSTWYYKFYRTKMNSYDFTVSQINDYVSLAKGCKLGWVQ